MRNFALIGFVIISLSLLPYTIGVAQNGDEILLEERFEDGEKKEEWKVLKADIGSGWGVADRFLKAFGTLTWQLKIPFSKERVGDELYGGIQFEFRYKVERSRDDQSFIVGVGFEVKAEERIEFAAAAALNASNLAYVGADGWNVENKGSPARTGQWHSARIVLDKPFDDTFDVYLNGNPVELRVPLLAKGQAVNCVLMSMQPNARGSKGEWHIDDLVVSVLPFAVEPLDRLITTWSKLKAGQ